jgi:8-oxo-dGTP diphosphatase
MNKFDVVRVGVALAVVRGNQVLLHKRKGVHAGGFWAFAGGHLEKWEEIEDCCLRELAEEVGSDFQVENIRFCTLLNTKYPEEDRHYVTIIMVADWVYGVPKVMDTDKCECWEWHDWYNTPNPLMQGLQIMKEKGINPCQTV